MVVTSCDWPRTAACGACDLPTPRWVACGSGKATRGGARLRRAREGPCVTKRPGRRRRRRRGVAAEQGRRDVTCRVRRPGVKAAACCSRGPVAAGSVERIKAIEYYGSESCPACQRQFGTEKDWSDGAVI